MWERRMIKLYLILFFFSIESSSQYGDVLHHLKIRKRDKQNILGMSLPEYQYGRKSTLKRFLLILLPFVTSFAEFYQYTGKKRKDGNRKTQIPRQHGDLTTLNYLSSDNGKIRELLEKWKKLPLHAIMWVTVCLVMRRHILFQKIVQLD